MAGVYLPIPPRDQGRKGLFLNAFFTQRDKQRKTSPFKCISLFIYFASDQLWMRPLKENKTFHSYSKMKVNWICGTFPTPILKLFFSFRINQEPCRKRENNDTWFFWIWGKDPWSETCTTLTRASHFMGTRHGTSARAAPLLLLTATVVDSHSKGWLRVLACVYFTSVSCDKVSYTILCNFHIRWHGDLLFMPVTEVCHCWPR